MGYIAIDQYGQTVQIKQHPRKELVEQFGGSVSKMYIDKTDGSYEHIGYVVGSLWFTVYKVQPLHGGNN